MSGAAGRFRWLTPAAPAAIGIVQASVLPALLDRPLPEVGTARFARLLQPGGGIADDVLVGRLAVAGAGAGARPGARAADREAPDEVLHLMVHGGPGQRQLVTACLMAHGLQATDPADLAAAPGSEDALWLALAAAPCPAALRWLLGHGVAPPPWPARFLRQVPSVLITGPVNAGKSTLLNAWSGQQRALVSARPGTTRDLLQVTVRIGAWRVHLIDSAGLRPTADAIEAAGQDLVRQARTRADAVLFLHPADAAPGSPAAEVGDVVVLGKADLAGALPRAVPAWSAHGLPGRSCEQLIADLGRAVLAALALPERE